MINQVLIISFWNPTPRFPNKGIFIKDQVDSISKYKGNIIFLEINILPKKTKVFEKEFLIKKSDNNTYITLNIYSIFWKFIFVVPDFVYYVVKKVLKSHFDTFVPEIVHSNVIFPCGFVGARFAKLYRSKHIISEHWSKFEKLLSNPIYGKRALNIYKECDAIICVSEYLVNSIKSKTKSNNIIQIPNIIDTEIFNYKERKLTDVNSLNIICIAIWELPKRLDLIIESLITFAMQSNKMIVLNVIGEGSQRIKYINKPNLPNLKINFLGYLSKKAIASILNITDFLMHASNRETFSIVTAEALSTGTPVLVSNVGALPELVTINNGYTVDNNLESWVAGLEKISNTSYDSSLISELVINKFSPKAFFLRINEVYNNIIQKK